MRSWKYILPLLAPTLCFAAQPDRIVGTIESGPSIALAKSLHPNAKLQYDLGIVEPSLKLSYVTLLMRPSPSQQKALDQFLVELQDRNSPNYHKWLTPQQFADRFGLSQNDLNKVTGWLRAEGFQILRTGGGRNSVTFSGNAAQAQHAFGVEIHYYGVDGEQHFANSSPIMVPAALNGIVRSVTGLHNFRALPAYRRRGAGAMSRRDYYDAAYLWPNFIAPGDMATIYDIDALYNASPAIDGTGQKVAIAGETDILLADINDFRNGFGLNPIPTTGSGSCTTNASGIVISPCDTANFSYVLVGADSGTISAYDIGEADLDIEWSGAVARNAQIIFVNAPATEFEVFDALTYAIDPGAGLPPLAPVVSASYGEGCEAQATDDLEGVLQQGNAEGVTIMIASGDIGAAGCDFNPPGTTRTYTPPPPYSPAVGGWGVSYPASSPEVTAVGGTEITIADDPNPAALPYWSSAIGANGGTALEYIPEIAWNDDEQLGGFCAANAGNPDYYSLCDPPASNPPEPGVKVTNAQTFQQDWWISSSGGGASNCWYETDENVCLGPGAGPTTGGGFAQPLWQQGLSVPDAPAGVRYVPDVSFMSSPNFPGYVFCTPIDPPSNNTSTCASGIFIAVDSYESLVGGTSVASPAFAGMVALLNQYLGTPSGSGLGNINTTLYAAAANPSNGAFHRITSGDNNVYCQPTMPSGQPSNVVCPSGGVLGFSASNADTPTGYNLVTGLGSVDVDKLFLAWNAAANPPDFTLGAGTLLPASIPAGQSASATLTIAPVNGSTQTINFTPSSCTGLTGASCSFNPTSVTLTGTAPQTVQVTVSTLANMALPTGAQTITISGSASGTGGKTHTAQVTLTVTATNQSFTIASTNGNSYSVNAGGTAPVNIAVTGTNGFIITSISPSTTALPITYSCTGLPSESSCNFSPSNGQNVSAISVTLNIGTTAPTSELRPPLGRGRSIFYALLLPGIFGVVFAAGSRTRAARLLGMIVVLGISTLWLGACGGGSSNSNQSNPGTPPGKYSVVVNATTGGANPLSGTFPVQLIVTAP